MRSAVELCSGALMLLGFDGVSSLENEGSVESQTAAEVYTPQRILLLTKHRWNFARNFAVLSPLADKTAGVRKNAFPLPDDCLNIRKTSDRNSLISGRYVLSDEELLKIDYTANVVEEVSPVFFDAALETMLAAVLAVPLLKKTDLADYYAARFEAQFSEAKSIDAQQINPPVLLAKPLGGLRA